MDANKIAANWEELIGIIDVEFTGLRKTGLINLYTTMQDEMMMAPASGYEHFHNAFPGGYVDHVLRVIRAAVKVNELWYEMGSLAEKVTREELIFTALNHDLGKAGTVDQPYYIPNNSEWHRKNQGKLYEVNPEITNMTVPHRGLWLLNQFGISYSESEMIAILTHDGMYDDSNSYYLKPYGDKKQLRNNLPIILHQADMIASNIEYEIWKNNGSGIKPTVAKPSRQSKPELSSASDDAKDIFANLFGEK